MRKVYENFNNVQQFTRKKNRKKEQEQKQTNKQNQPTNKQTPNKTVGQPQQHKSSIRWRPLLPAYTIHCYRRQQRTTSTEYNFNDTYLDRETTDVRTDARSSSISFLRVSASQCSEEKSTQCLRKRTAKIGADGTKLSTIM